MASKQQQVVSLLFKADTTQAKAALQDLHNQLKDIQNQPTDLVDDVDIRRAAQAAQELQRHLSAAVNVDTGKLDLGRFSQSLTKSGKNLKYFYNELASIGPQGRQAFLTLAKSIATADTATLKLNKKFSEFAQTLKNTAKWQLSSSILHGLMGAVQGAYGYAQDLDRSLTKISIVTGKGRDEMAQFAREANHAAQALSTTTTQYADAALIFYQQGLGSAEVQRRTEATIKMAHAAGESAEEVSSYMTAIWNNFADGSKTIEYYGDVLQELGATTAASAAEIAEGLEKFAAIGETVGLSYEYAASAIATVVDKTRQSAEVVGTAFKTIFSRMQGLNLGETLDDGTDLNKYSQALLAVGINIKDAKGGLKDMNVILDEMGAKWQTLHRDEQMALAQTVAGVRQYTQLMSLMNNYDDFKSNVSAAEMSTGALDIAAERYANSWEGARDRVKSAMEGVYDALIDENFFISMDNGLTGLINGVQGLVKGMGGLGGIMTTVGGLFMTHFAKEMPSALNSLINTFSVFSGKAVDDATNAQSQLDKILTNMPEAFTDQFQAQVFSLQNLNSMTQQLAKEWRFLTEEERESYQVKIDSLQKMYEMLQVQKEQLDTAKQQTSELESQAVSKAADKVVKSKNKGKPNDKKTTKNAESQKINEQIKALKDLIKEQAKVEKSQQRLKRQAEVWVQNKKYIGENELSVQELKEKILTMIKDTKGVNENTEQFKKLKAALDNAEISAEELKVTFNEFANGEGSQPFAEVIVDSQTFEQRIASVVKELERMKVDPKVLETLQQQYRDNALSAEDYEAALANLRAEAEKGLTHQAALSEGLTKVGGAAMSILSIFQEIPHMVDIFTDEDATAVQKVGAAIGVLTTLFAAHKTITEALQATETIYSGIQEILAKRAQARANRTVADSTKVTIAKGVETGSWWANTFAQLANPVTAGIAAAAIAGAIVVFAGLSAAIDINTEKVEQNAEALRETADASKEELDRNQELAKAYKDALSAYEDGTGTKEELTKATDELVEAYDDENIRLLALKGNYNQLTKAVDNYNRAQLKEAKYDTKAAKDEAAKVFRNDMREGLGNVGEYGADKYGVLFGGGADGTGDEQSVNQAMRNAGFTPGNAIVVDDTSEGLISAYEQVQAIVAETKKIAAETGEDLTKSERYQAMVDWLLKSEESYNNLIALQDQLNELTVQDAVADLSEKYGEIASMEEYLKMERELINTLLADESLSLTADEAERLAEAALKSNEAYSEMASNARVIKNTSQAAFSKFDKKTLQQFYDSLSEEDKKFFATLEFDTAQSTESLQVQIDAMQAEADANAVRVKIQGVQQAQSDLKEDMTSDELLAFRDQTPEQYGFEWGKDGVIEFTEFVKLTYEEQYEYLQKLEDDYNSERRSKDVAALEAQKQVLAQKQKDLEEAWDTFRSTAVGGAANQAAHDDVQKLTEEIEALEQEIQGAETDLEIDAIVTEQSKQRAIEEAIELGKEMAEEAAKAMEEAANKVAESTNPIVAAFNNASDGIKKAMDESGNTVWDFSAEAAKAIEAIYPGFMEQAKLMDDGTFRVSQSMYQSIFDTTEGILALERKATKEKLKDLAKEAFIKADYYEEASKLAGQLARGEITNEEQVAKAQALILEASQKARAEYGENLVTIAENTVNGMIDGENQYRTALFETADYADKLSKGAAENMVINTAEAVVASAYNLSSLAISGAQTAQQMAEIGNDPPAMVTVDDPDVVWTVGSTTGKKTLPPMKKDTYAVAEVKKTAFANLAKDVAQGMNLDISDGLNQEEMQEVYKAIEESLAEMGSRWRDVGNSALEAIANMDSSFADFASSLAKNGKITLETLEEIIDKLHLITKQIEAQDHILDRLAKRRDRSYGKEKIAIMEQESKELEKQLGLQNSLLDLQTGIWAANTKTITDKFSAEFDEYGNISNYNSIVQGLQDELQVATNTINEARKNLTNSKDENAKAALDAAEDAYKAAQEKYDADMALLTAYEDSLTAYRDQVAVIEDLIYQIQDLNYEKLKESLNVKLEVSDNILNWVDLMIERLEDNFFKLSEIAGLLSNEKLDAHIQQIEDYEGQKGMLDQAYLKGEISYADYIAGVKEVKDGIKENISALIALDKQMMHYYEDTLTQASEELETHTKHMRALTGVFDHYLNLMDLLGKSKDYKAMNNFLSGKAQTLRDQLDVAKEYYEMLQSTSKADEYWANYQQALKDGDEDMAQWWKEQWQADVAAMDAAQEEMLSLTEEWAEAMKTKIELAMEEIAESLENAMTNGMGFDYLMDSFDKLNTRQEEYLTKTNQIYETNKLMRTANKALDEADSAVAKQKLKNFITETQNLQQNTKLSKYELEIQQAKYDLLLAEIALEEAQNAKSTVRQVRDNEGNFGYVYTADADQIADAQQKVDDANNNIYNKALEAQQQYTEKYLQAEKEMYDELEDLKQQWMDGLITDEEYYERRSAIHDHYLGEDGVLTTYSKLYNIAVQTDADATRDYWAKDYGDMTQKTEEWSTSVQEYYTKVEESVGEWKEVAKKANEDVGGALDDSTTATKNLTDESEKLKNMLVDQLIPKIGEEIKAVQELTDAYAAQRKEILELIDAKIAMLKDMGLVGKAELGFDKNTDYSALMNEYLSQGGSTSDATYQELLRQRDLKIEWLKTEEGGNKDESYWRNQGQDTTDMYDRIMRGEGTEEENEWFKKNYVDNDKLAGIFTMLGIPLEELIAVLANLTDAINNDLPKDGEENKPDPATEAVINAGAEIKGAVTTTGDTIIGAVTTTGDGAIGAIDNGTKTVTTGVDELGTQTVEELEKTQQELTKRIDDLEKYVEDLEKQIDELSGDLTDGLGDNAEILDNMVQELQVGMNGVGDELLKNTDVLSTGLLNMSDSVSTNLFEVSDSLENHALKTEQGLKNMTDTTAAAIDETNKQLGDNASAVERHGQLTQEGLTTLSSQTTTSLGNMTTSVSGSVNAVAVSVDTVGSHVNASGQLVSSSVNSVAGAVGGIPPALVGITNAIHDVAGAVSSIQSGVGGTEVNPSEVQAFDTGGYTGDWGPAGKLAILHQKEMVLNQQDTSNLLSAVNIIREIVSAIDLQAGMPGLISLQASGGSAFVGGHGTMEQTVTITAEFPNATDRYEIEEAFNNLVNHASQYANRK